MAGELYAHTASIPDVASVSEPPVDPAELAAGQGAQVLATEEAAATGASADVQAQIAETVAFALATWAVLGDSEPDEARRRIRVRLLAIRPASRQGLLDAFSRALQLGASHGLEQIGGRHPWRGRKLRLSLTAELRREAQQADVEARHAIEAAARIVDGARSLPQLQAGLAKANGAVTSIEGVARWGVNRAHSTGVTTVADAVNAGRLWIAERDACVHCLAYAGTVADNGTPFPGGLTYGKRPIGYSPVVDPPLHRFCRCHVMVWLPQWGRDFPLSLDREARRSIVRGFSLPSESERVRLDAARRLLAAGAGLPKSVEEYGQASVRRGRFGEGRAFPYRPRTGGRRRR